MNNSFCRLIARRQKTKEISIRQALWKLCRTPIVDKTLSWLESRLSLRSCLVLNWRREKAGFLRVRGVQSKSRLLQANRRRRDRRFQTVRPIKTLSILGGSFSKLLLFSAVGPLKTLTQSYANLKLQKSKKFQNYIWIDTDWSLWKAARATECRRRSSSKWKIFEKIFFKQLLQPEASSVPRLWAAKAVPWGERNFAFGDISLPSVSGLQSVQNRLRISIRTIFGILFRWMQFSLAFDTVCQMKFVSRRIVLLKERERSPLCKEDEFRQESEVLAIRAR